MKNYRISFDLSAEDPRHAVMYLAGIVEDPDLRDTEFNWTVEDLESGEQTRVRASFNELETEAAGELQRFLDGLKREI